MKVTKQVPPPAPPPPPTYSIEGLTKGELELLHTGLGHMNSEDDDACGLPRGTGWNLFDRISEALLA